MTVPAVMFVTIILIHETAKYFGKEISCIPLTVCAVLSILINAASIFTTAKNDDYFFKLFILIFIATIFVTVLNRFLEVRK